MVISFNSYMNIFSSIETWFFYSLEFKHENKQIKRSDLLKHLKDWITPFAGNLSIISKTILEKPEIQKIK